MKTTHTGHYSDNVLSMFDDLSSSEERAATTSSTLSYHRSNNEAYFVTDTT